MAPTHLLVNAQVRTFDARGRVAEALAWRGDRLLAVGGRAEVARVAGPEARVLDAGGATVLPGFIDAHQHPSIVALYGGVARLAPPAVTDVASLQRTLAAAAARIPGGSEEWLVATDWDEVLLAERRPPTRRELDDAVPDRPLLALHYSCHRAVVNSRALELAGIGKGTADPSGGVIGRGPGGLPDGLLVERAMCRAESLARASLLARDARDSDAFYERLSRHHQALVAKGITRVADAAVPGDLMDVYREAARRGTLLVPTIAFPVSTRGYFEAAWDVLDGPVTAEASDGLLTVGPLKLVFDGAPGCAMCLSWWQASAVFVRTLAMCARQGSLFPLRTAMSMTPRYGRQLRTGIHIYGRDEAARVVRAAAERGFAVATHAIGNAAIDVALDAYESAGAALRRGGPPRVEHGSFLSREQVRRLAGLGIAVVAQPHFVTLPAYSGAAEVPGVRNNALRWLLDAGVTVAGSSDAPVVSFDPLDGVRSAIRRRTARGHVYDEDQRISLDEALAIFTRGAAAACGCLDRAGTLEPGKRADVVVLDRALTGDGDALDRARVRATVLGGEVVFGAIDASDAAAA